MVILFSIVCMHENCLSKCCANVAETIMFSAAYIFYQDKFTCIASYKTNMLSSFIDENKKLDLCVLVAVLGFESMDGAITDSQFVYNEDERRDNYIKGSREAISTYLIEHFCCPSGTILDASSDLKGEK